MRPLLTVSASLALAAAAHAENGDRAVADSESPIDLVPGGTAAPEATQQPAGGQAGRFRRLPGFAATLANQPVVRDARDWDGMPMNQAWREIVGSDADARQNARWRYARSLIANERWPEALGVLETMKSDDPDLALVASFRLALAVVQTGMGRYADALASLSADELTQNPEACAWRMRALEGTGLHEEALVQWPCARSAVTSRSGARRAQFLLVAARSAEATERLENALQLLSTMPENDAEANLIRGRVLLKLGQSQDGRHRLARAKDNGNIAQRMDAEVSLIEALVAAGKAEPRRAYGELDRLSYIWRGDKIERRALTLRLQLAETIGDDQAALRSGAALFRYHPPAGDTGDLLAALRQRMSAIVSPESKVALPEAAGLFWEYRDIAPSGAEGDFLVSQLAERLQSARLYDRAAQLLDYQLMARLKDVSQGPLSVRVARLYILAGKPADALRAISSTEDNLYPTEIIWSRKRIEAIALHQLGRTAEALAVLEGVPDGALIRREIEWAGRDWKSLADAEPNVRGNGGKLSEVDQAVILRRAVALAMLGREADLSKLRSRYQTAFAKLPTGPAFDLLTGAVGSLDSAVVARAMAAIPSASPAGDIADLLAAKKEEA